MGTTTQGETYSLKLKGVGREILIIDSPSILEAGIAGTEREDEFVKSPKKLNFLSSYELIIWRVS